MVLGCARASRARELRYDDVKHYIPLALHMLYKRHYFYFHCLSVHMWMAEDGSVQLMSDPFFAKFMLSAKKISSCLNVHRNYRRSYRARRLRIGSPYV